MTTTGQSPLMTSLYAFAINSAFRLNGGLQNTRSPPTNKPARRRPRRDINRVAPCNLLLCKQRQA